MINKKRLIELSDFLNLDQRMLLKMDKSIQDLPGFAKWINIAIEDWNFSKVNQKNKEEIERWFRNNDKYIFELSDVHSRPTKKNIIKEVIRICKKHQIKDILDYGGGIGEEAIQYAKSGMNATMADLPSLTFDFAKWRAKRYELNIKFVKLESDVKINKRFDAITCFEVLQHTFNPKQVAQNFIDMLNKNGLIFITTRFNNPDYPMALKKNFHLKEGMEDFFTEQGLELIYKIYQYGHKDRKKYLYIYQKED